MIVPNESCELPEVCVAHVNVGVSMCGLQSFGKDIVVRAMILERIVVYIIKKRITNT